MQIELSDEEIKAIKARAAKVVEAELVEQIRLLVNPSQVHAEIKNEVVRALTQNLAAKFEKKYESSEVIKRAVESAESRVNAKIARILANGITIKFAE